MNQWIIPSGFLECGETLQECAARETVEETGVVVSPAQLDLYSVINLVKINQVVISFRVDLDSEPLMHPGSECHQVAFLTEDELNRIDLAWIDQIGEAPKRFFEEMRANKYGIHLTNIGPSL